MAVLDATILVCLIDPNARVPKDPETGEEIKSAKARIIGLIKQLERSKQLIVIPTPALSEAIIRISSKESNSLVEELNGYSNIHLAPFDFIAALELAEITRRTLDDQELQPASNSSRAKLKFDRQILAITITQGEDVIYSDDQELCKFAQRLGLETIGLHQIPIPVRQTNVPFQERFNYS